MRNNSLWSRARLLGGMLAVAVALFAAQGFSLGSYGIHNKTRTVGADPVYKSCFTVVHEYGPTTTESANVDLDYVATDGDDGSTYIVQYRLRQISNGAWTSWATPSESTGSMSAGTYSYEYDTGAQNGSTYDEVEWKVNTDEHSGTNLRSLETMVSVDDAEILGSTILNTSGPCHDDETVNQSQWDWAMVGYQH